MRMRIQLLVCGLAGAAVFAADPDASTNRPKYIPRFYHRVLTQNDSAAPAADTPNEKIENLKAVPGAQKSAAGELTLPVDTMMRMNPPRAGGEAEAKKDSNWLKPGNAKRDGKADKQDKPASSGWGWLADGMAAQKKEKLAQAKQDKEDSESDENALSGGKNEDGSLKESMAAVAGNRDNLGFQPVRNAGSDRKTDLADRAAVPLSPGAGGDRSLASLWGAGDVRGGVSMERWAVGFAPDSGRGAYAPADLGRSSGDSVPTWLAPGPASAAAGVPGAAAFNFAAPESAGDSLRGAGLAIPSAPYSSLGTIQPLGQPAPRSDPAGAGYSSSAGGLNLKPAGAAGNPDPWTDSERLLRGGMLRPDH